jgi:hypothetical protein
MAMASDMFDPHSAKVMVIFGALLTMSQRMWWSRIALIDFLDRASLSRYYVLDKKRRGKLKQHYRVDTEHYLDSKSF